MSATFPAEIACTKCGSTLSVELFTNLHVTRSPERRLAILEGRFSVFECPSCATRIRVEPTMLYTDFERWKWYAVFPRAAITHRGELARLVEEGFRHNLEVAAPAVVRSWAPNFARRVVFGLDALRDKLLCDDAGVDDRALEALKWMVLRESAPTAIHPQTGLYLEAIESDRLLLRLEPPKGPDGTVVVRVLGVERARLGEAMALVGSLPLGGDVVDWRAPLWPDRPLTDPVGAPRLRTPWMSS